ncbi:MAG: hypothetical protein ACE37I_06645 [Rubinisphaera brasiliensis]|uniref:hypothetical protein n=1 Tax=Rubinisphaera brasiliensis TaxID=119 RepID=UPI003919C27E
MRSVKKLSSRLLILSAVAGCLLPSGCASLPASMPRMPWAAEKEEMEFATAREPAAEVVCVWQPARGKGLNGVPSRGVGGQLMFFTRSKAEPVAVEGDVRIYLFDNQGTVQEQAQPIHQFDFPAEQWSSYLAMGNLGPSYNIFIPYTRGGHKQVECTLQVLFKPKDGPAVYSDLASMTLPGILEDNTAQRKAEMAAEEAAELKATARAKRNTVSGLKVKTIDPRKPAELTQESKVAQFLDDNPDVEEQLRSLHREGAADIESVGKTVEHTTRKPVANSGKIQQVSAEVHVDAEQEAEPEAKSPEAKRIERLEQMLQQLLEEKQASQASLSARPEPVKQVSHADLEFLPPHHAARGDHVWSEATGVAALEESQLGWALPEPEFKEPIPLAKQATHPLRMEPAAASTSELKRAKPAKSPGSTAKRHPLSDWE